jgi:hypothetical protein
MWFSRILLAGVIFGSSWSFIVGYFFFFVSGTDVIFWTHSVISHPQPLTSGRPREEWQLRRCRHQPEVEDEGHLKNFIVVFIFVKALCNVQCFS